MVPSVTARLLKVFRERDYHTDHHLFVIPQQCYLYVEVQRFPFGSRRALPPVTTSSTTHKPLGRIKYLGDPEKWEYQPYRFADNFWDHEHGLEVGTPETLMLGMLVKLGC